MTAILRLTDDTKEVDFLDPSSGWWLKERKQGTPELKGGGTYRESPMSDGRRLVSKAMDNAVEIYTLALVGRNQDAAARHLQRLVAMLEQATDYWTADWKDSPVWIEDRGDCETNSQYSLVHNFKFPALGDRQGQPWVSILMERAAMEDLDLVIEREPWWRGDEPGAGTAVQLSNAKAECCWPHPLEFDGVDDYIDCNENPPVTDDWPDDTGVASGKITMEAWINPDDWGEGGVGEIINKGLHWEMWIEEGRGLCARIDCATQDAISYSGTDDFSPDEDWHHVAAVYSETGVGVPVARTIYLMIDWTWVASYDLQQASVGAYVSDIGDSIAIGNDITGALYTGATFDGLMGWVRVNSDIDYDPTDANITPLPRCTMPEDAGRATWIYEGVGNLAHPWESLQPDGSDPLTGTIVGATWADCDCDCADAGQAATTGQIYVTNHQKRAQLTHIFYYENGVGYSDNLLNDALPYALLPAIPTGGDYIFFGIESNTLDAAPFWSLVFNISQIMTGVTASEWQYYNGAWVANTVQDNTATTNPFDTLGVASVSWRYISTSDWEEDVVNGIEAWWVRLRIITAAGGQPPIQQTNHPYTVSGAFVDVAADQVGGDFPMLGKLKVFGNALNGQRSKRLVLGARTIARGADFQPYINFSQANNPDGITITGPSWADVFWIDDTSVAAGECIRTDFTDSEAMIRRAQISFSAALADQYRGEFRVFLRAKQVGGASGDLKAKLVIGPMISALYETDTVIWPETGRWLALDLGKWSYPWGGRIRDSESAGEFSITVHAQRVSGAATCRFADLVLMPMDEHAMEAIFESAGINTVDYALLDSISDPKLSVRVREYLAADDSLSGWGMPIVPGGRLRFPHDAQHRWWFFNMRDDDLENEYESLPQDLFEINAWATKLYHSVRGDR